MQDRLKKVKTLFTRSDFFMGALILAFVAGLSAFFIVKMVEYETTEAKENLKTLSHDVASQIRFQIDRALEINRYNKNFLRAACLQKNNHNIISRNEVLECFKEQLSDNPEFLGLYTLWEPNAFDTKDQQYIGQLYHDSTGRFVPYIFRYNNRTQIEPCLFYDSEGPYNYYQLPKKLRREVILNPYTYPIGNEQVYMISIITPIMINNEFKGITGVDYTVDHLQSIISNQKFQGQDVHVCIVASDTVIVAMEGHPEYSGKSIQSISGNKDQLFFQSEKKNAENDSLIITCTSIPIGDTQTSWKVCIAAPKTIIYSKAQDLVLKFVLGFIFVALLIGMARAYFHSKSVARDSKLTLQMIIDNIQHPIWAINKNYVLTVYNQSFVDTVKNNYDLDITPGYQLKLKDQRVLFWREKFEQGFKGLSTTFDKKYENGKSYQYWLYPLWIGNEITGVMAMAVDNTEKEEFYEINKKMTEYRIIGLQSAMNPHFMYNSLNSIQYFITKNERKMALDTLSLFSNLIRKILDSAVDHHVSLRTEMEILTHYIKLEKLRFEEKFTYAINIDSNIDGDTIHVPSFLIQPYVENAILHGLTNKEGRGHLNISISATDKMLVIVVEDDGIGRAKAKEINDSNIIKENEHRLLLSKERLSLINKTTAISVNTEDLENSNGAAAGTRVTITIEI